MAYLGPEPTLDEVAGICSLDDAARWAGVVGAVDDATTLRGALTTALAGPGNALTAPELVRIPLGICHQALKNLRLQKDLDMSNTSSMP